VKWIRRGTCQKCGKCCQANFLLKGLNFFERLLIKLYAGKKFKMLKGHKCHNLFEAGGKYVCMIYEHRPDFCQKYPASPRDLIPPDKVTPDCGFWFMTHGDDGFEKSRMNVAMECFKRNKPIEGTMYEDGTFEVKEG